MTNIFADSGCGFAALLAVGAGVFRLFLNSTKVFIIFGVLVV
jgi:hypothetical protein